MTRHDPTDDVPQTAPPSSRRRVLVPVALLLGLGALFLVGRELASSVQVFGEWVETQGALGPVVFVLGYAVAAVALVPGSLLTLAAGAIFGLWRGTLLVLVGATLGASAAFLIARYVARGAVERRLAGDERFERIDRAVGREGRRIVFLMRLSPVFPFSFLNYALGLTRVRFPDYLVACLGMLPGTLLYVYYGHLAGTVAAAASDGTAERGAGYWSVLVLGLLATIAVTTVVTRIARRALNEEASDDAD